MIDSHHYRVSPTSQALRGGIHKVLPALIFFPKTSWTGPVSAIVPISWINKLSLREAH